MNCDLTRDAMVWSLMTLLLLGSRLLHGTGAAHKENLQAAQVVGTVLCAPCFNRGFSRTGHFISGASVLLECTGLSFRKEVMTDEHGKFEVHLPPSPSEDAAATQGCTVKLIKSNNPGCDAVSSRDSLHLELNAQQPQVLSAGVLAFTPREQPSTCARKAIRRGAMESGSKKVSISSESARWSISEPAPAPVTSPPVLGSTALPPLPSIFFPPTPGVTPRPPGIKFPFPPLPQPPIPSPPSMSLPPRFRLPLPPLPPVPPRLPLPPLPPFRFPPTPAATPPRRPIHFTFPPFPQPPIRSFPFPLPPLPPLPLKVPFPLPPLPGFAPPPSTPSP